MHRLGNFIRISFLIFLVTLLNACSLSSRSSLKDGPPLHPVDVSKIPNPKPQDLPRSRYGNPPSYVANGRRYYVLKTTKNYRVRGIASWYGRKFQGRLTSSREPYNLYAMTAASPVLPIPSFVQVTNLENGRSVIVKVNDRGPFVPNRIIDLSYVAAKKLGYAAKGTALVQVSAINKDRNINKNLFANHTTRHHLYLQVGAFSEYSHAQRLKHEIAMITRKQIRITTGQYAKGKIYRVQIGPLIGVSESDRLLHKLARQGFGHAFTVIS